jgi:hypothetical protein
MIVNCTKAATGNTCKTYAMMHQKISCRQKPLKNNGASSASRPPCAFADLPRKVAAKFSTEINEKLCG